MKKNIALLGTYYEQSHGDALLFDCVEYIYSDLAKKYNLDMNFKYIDILRKTKINYENEYAKKIEDNFIKNKLKKIKFLHKLVRFIKEKKNQHVFKVYFKNQLKNMNLIVIVGGGLFKYSVRTNFVPIFKTIIKVAKKYDIPVIFNALGIEGNHNEKDKSFKELKKIMNNDIIKMCSTRDRFEVLKSYIDNGNIICEKVADTGVWTSEALKIKKKSNSNLIGLNVITPERFLDYGKNISEEDLILYWENLICELKNRKYDIRLFVNGMIADYEFALKIAKRCKLKRNMIFKNPSNEIEMVKNISKFRAIIANRLHTCIASYSLDIPVVGLAWNDKLLYWGESIQLPERFLDYNELDYRKTIEILEQAIKVGYDQKFKEDFKKSIYNFLEKSIYYIK